MKVIIAGSRDITDMNLLLCALDIYPIDITEVVSGGANGVDRLGEEWAKEHNVPLTIFPAEWDKYGKIAGPIRNGNMAFYADALVAIWDGKSRGTKNMVDQMNKLQKPSYIFQKEQLA